MRSELIKLLRELENESGFRNKYSECSEKHDCHYEITENIDFPNFRLISEKFNAKYPTTYGSLVLYSDTAIRAELVRMESDGLALIGTQKAIIQGASLPPNAGPDIENAESTTERVILTTQGKSSLRYFMYKVTKEPVSFSFALLALIISIASLSLTWPTNTESSVAHENLGNAMIATDSVSKECPFVSTAVTGKCLDLVLERKENEAVTLATALTHLIQVKIQEIKGSPYEPDTLAYSTLLDRLANYQAVWKTYRKEKCELELALVTGSAIVEDSLKCQIRETDEYIKILKEHVSWF